MIRLVVLPNLQYNKTAATLSAINNPSHTPCAPIPKLNPSRYPQGRPSNQ